MNTEYQKKCNQVAHNQVRCLAFWVVVPVFLCGVFFISACKKSVTSSSQQVPAAASQADFTDAQNDGEGYDGKLWGTKSVVTGNGLESEERELLGLVFNVPVTSTIIGGANLGERLDTSSLPEFTSESAGSVSYVYRNGELAMAFVKLDAHNYESVKGTIEGKGYPRMGDSSKSYRRLGDESDGDSTGLEQVLYKRENTNTRVYLMKYIDRSPLGNTWSAHLLYIPNHYYNLISSEMQNAQARRNSAAANAAEQQAEPDKQRVQ